MNPLHVIGIVAGCLLIFSAVVTFLTLQGVPLLLAFLGVYLAVIGTMMGMQRRAREICESLEQQRRESSNRSGVAFLQTQLPLGPGHGTSMPDTLPIDLRLTAAANSGDDAAPDAAGIRSPEETCRPAARKTRVSSASRA